MSVRNPKCSHWSMKAVQGIRYQQYVVRRTCETGRFWAWSEKEELRMVF